MMIQEFEKLSGIYPTAELYREIEAAYYHFPGGKESFCKAYRENADGIQERIQAAADKAHYEQTSKAAQEIEALKAQIQKLTEKLEREQEWKPYEDRENVEQADYDRLRNDSSTEIMSDDEAKELLYDWFGFAPEKVEILHTVPVYEVNRHRELRKIGETDRTPCYNATDWNYIRFDCGMRSYELYNDDLRPYYQ